MAHQRSHFPRTRYLLALLLGSAGCGAARAPAAREPESPMVPQAEREPPRAPATVSVTIRNECPHTVKVFYGEDPKFGSGTLSTLGGNSLSNHSFEPGDTIWLVDDERNGLGSVTVAPGVRELEITKSCTGFGIDR